MYSSDKGIFMFKGFCNDSYLLGNFSSLAKFKKFYHVLLHGPQSKTQDKMISFKDMSYQDVTAVC